MGIVDILSIGADEFGVGEGEAEIRIGINIAKDAASAARAAKAGSSFIPPLANYSKKQNTACPNQRQATIPKGIGGGGWRGDPNWKKAVDAVDKGGTIDKDKLGSKVRPTLQEARDLIGEAGGTIDREDIAGHPAGGVSTHLDPHINYRTIGGSKGTIYIQPPG